MDEDAIVLKLNSENTVAPAVMTNEKEYKYIIMPLR